MKINKAQKQLIKVYMALFLFIFIGMNWDAVSWVFSYRVIGGLTEAFFNPYPESELLAGSETQASALNIASAATAKNYPYSEKNNSIEIPRLAIEAPIVISQTTNTAALTKDLDNGVVYYPGSATPGQNGQMVVLGHSAPPGWPHVKYDWVFSDISNLAIGETVIIHFNHARYTYKIIGSEIIQPGQDVSISPESKDNNVLVMISCWPPGKDYKRIAVKAELVKN